MKELTIRLIGVAPLLMNADRLCNPLDPATIDHKRLTSKRTKTEDDNLSIAKSSYMGSLYCDEGGPYLPTANIRAALVGGAKKSKRGAQMKSGAMILADRAPLDYPGPRLPQQLETPAFVDARSVVNPSGKQRIIRYRPRFNQWAVSVAIAYDPKMLDADHLLEALDLAGRYIGVGDYRPEKGGLFGRFSPEVAP
ncbi:MAG: hypothetical protein IPL51_09010 [Candidatus Competibacteraceae bacterium]|nr:hypothetical protein [Candidatus Competibacteraceae bacterium]